MPYFPTLDAENTTQQITDTFLGYNHNLKIADGEFFDMQNLSSSDYPLLSNRAKRGVVSTLTAPHGLLAKSKLAYIDGTSLFYDGADITSYLTSAGFSISSATAMLPKQLISIGAYIIIYPDKLFINTENYTDCGSIDAFFSTVADADVSYTLCKSDGTSYATPTVSASAPASPENGDLWIDTSGDAHTLKQYSAVTDEWVQLATCYVKIAYAGIGNKFSKYDGVSISGCAGNDQIAALNGSKIIYALGDDYVVVVGLIDTVYTQSSGAVVIKRKMPDIDFITESENRLWGCKYGLVDGKTVNEIYCCALGDFKNWNQFLGISTDSWVASVGTDGPWTGAVTHLGYPVFFKEHVLHKIYISSTGAHQIVDTACRGVQKGSSGSLVVVGETLYYKSSDGVCFYDGSLPQSVGDQFGDVRYFDAVAGAVGSKYYISMRDASSIWHMFVLDTSKGLWHREDNTHALFFARMGDELCYVDGNTSSLMAALGTAGTLEANAVAWSAETGIMGYTYINQKYVTRFNLRMKLPSGSTANVYIQYDSDGIWHECGHMTGSGTRTFMLPVRPRRCDHFQFKISGTGDVRIFSFARLLAVGSDELCQ